MNQQVFDQILQAIGTVGFPICVAAYLLLRDSRRMEKFTEVLLELKVAIEALAAKIE